MQQPSLLRLNLQYFADELSDAPESQDWSSYLSEQLSEVADDQLETESETEEVSEDTEEVTDDSEEVESDEESTEESAEEKPAFDDDTLIDLGDGTQPIPLKELKAGNLRQADYTKKTQALSDEKKAFESEREQLRPVQEYKQFLDSNPYLIQKFNEWVGEWHNTGREIPPIDEVMNYGESQYLNEAIKQINQLQTELDQIKGEHLTFKFDSDMRSLVTDLKAEYGDLIDSEYEQSLIDQAKEQGLSTDVLKRIAKGDLAEKKLQQAQEEGKKAEAKTKQKIRETKLPPQPKKVGNQPAKEDVDLSGDWLSIFKQVGK